MRTKLFGKTDVRMLIVGLDSAGKTTILYQLKSGETVNTQPTIEFNLETLDYKGLNYTMFDVGGRNLIRVLWRHYYKNTDGLIFVADSNDIDRFDDCAELFKKMLSYEELKDCAVLVMTNKQDLNGAMSPNEVTDKLGMSQLTGRQWLVQGTSAIIGGGLKEGFDWMAEVLLKRNKNKLNFNMKNN